jgi:hypothetical protein
MINKYYWCILKKYLPIPGNCTWEVIDSIISLGYTDFGLRIFLIPPVSMASAKTGAIFFFKLDYLH